MKIIGCDWVSIPLTCEKEKKVSLDLYQERDWENEEERGGKGNKGQAGRGKWGYGEALGGIHCTLRAHSMSHLSTGDVALSIPSSPVLFSPTSTSTSSSSPFSTSFSSPTASSMHLPIKSPTALSVTVTEITIYSDAVLINRTGKPLRVRTMRKGSYVQRDSYTAAVNHLKYDGGVGGLDIQLQNEVQVLKAASSSCNSRLESGSESKLESKSELGSGSGSGLDLEFESHDDDRIFGGQVPSSQMGTDGRDICLHLKEESKCRREIYSNKNRAMTSIFALEEKRAGDDNTEAAAAAGDRMEFNLENFTVRSRRIYRIMNKVQIGDIIYTDRPHLKWSHLPPILM